MPVDNQLDNLQARLVAIENSLSWRITKPLRAFMDILLRLKRSTATSDNLGLTAQKTTDDNFEQPDRGILPSSFSPEIYKKYSPDLDTQSNLNQLWLHYKQVGEQEGRRAYAFTNRLELAKYVPDDKSVLEISPFTAPFFSGVNVMYADILSTDELIARAKNLNLDFTQIPKIDYVVKPSDLKSINRTFDFVASSHVIEHQPDLIGHFNSVSELLKSDGQYIAVIPDKRYCFDHFQPETSISEVIEAHLEKRTVHTPNNVIKHLGMMTHNFADRHWRGDHGVPDYETSLDKINSAVSEWKEAAGGYIDVHSWFFTPNSFEKIINELNSLGFIKIRISRLWPTTRNSLEFYCALQLDSGTN